MKSNENYCLPSFDGVMNGMVIGLQSDQFYH
jgi:hypothetical protein